MKIHAIYGSTYKDLLKENKELQQRIDKAIEYIKHYGNLYCVKHTQFKKYKQYEELLEILGGVNEKDIINSDHVSFNRNNRS